MIVDVHTHPPSYRGVVPEDKKLLNTLWRPDRAVEAVVNWDAYLKGVAAADRAIVFNIAWRAGETAGAKFKDQRGDIPGNLNDVAAALVKANPDKLIGFMALHPFDDNLEDEFERCRVDLGMKGIKLGANYQNFDPLEPRALKIYDLAQRYGLPILFHQGTSPVRFAPIIYSHPLKMDEIAMRYPNLKIIMAHMGHPWTVDTAVVIRKHPNLFADVSALFYRPYTLYEAMIKATEWNVLHKIMLGSDFPVATTEETMNGMRKVNDILEGTKLPRVPEEKIEAILNRDSLSLLGLS
jgi:uncharacterized protein